MKKIVTQLRHEEFQCPAPSSENGPPLPDLGLSLIHIYLVVGAFGGFRHQFAALVAFERADVEVAILAAFIEDHFGAAQVGDRYAVLAK